jgi:hypothetical protein
MKEKKQWCERKCDEYGVRESVMSMSSKKATTTT